MRVTAGSNATQDGGRPPGTAHRHRPRHLPRCRSRTCRRLHPGNVRSPLARWARRPSGCSDRTAGGTFHDRPIDRTGIPVGARIGSMARNRKLSRLRASTTTRRARQCLRSGRTNTPYQPIGIWTPTPQVKIVSFVPGPLTRCATPAFNLTLISTSPASKPA